ncbi:MAG TPA: ATPase, T2SS/T4P/T4SS family, partial [Clostridiaceae bacterium]|nr:ATPase, T2SS/T4P/T4SS family [Clostridiaceae bacterium]
MELNQIVETGISSHASDIHFIPHGDRVEVHFRTGDVLDRLMDLSPEKYQVMLQKVKASSAMNLSEKRLPQDGVMTILGKAVRVSTMRSMHGESLVIRLFDQEVGTLEALGIPEQ